MITMQPNQNFKAKHVSKVEKNCRIDDEKFNKNIDDNNENFDKNNENNETNGPIDIKFNGNDVLINANIL